MQLDEPFPIEHFPPRVRIVILSEFGGRHPTVREVVGIPDTHWLKLPTIGPGTVARLRSLTRGMRREIRVPSLAGLTDTELLAQREFLQGELRCIRDKIKANSAELWTRGIVSRT